MSFATGRHPGFFSFQQGRKLAAVFDAELGVCTREVPFDGLQRHVELEGDFAVGATPGGEPHDVQLPGAQRFQARAPRAPRAGAGGFEFFSHTRCQRAGAAAACKVESLGERLARGGAVTSPAQPSS